MDIDVSMARIETGPNAGRLAEDVIGELIEDSTVRMGGQTGTLTSSRVAVEVRNALLGDPHLVATLLGGEAWEDSALGCTTVTIRWHDPSGR